MTPLKIVIRLDQQKLYLCRGDEVLQNYPISSSRFGTGSEPGSFKTPLGRFEIAEKIGGDQPLNTVFRGRQPVLSDLPRAAPGGWAVGCSPTSRLPPWPPSTRG